MKSPRQIPTGHSYLATDSATNPPLLRHCSATGPPLATLADVVAKHALKSSLPFQGIPVSR